MSRKNKTDCHLPPYEVFPIMSLDEVKQTAGWEITAFNLPDAWSHTQGEGVKIAIVDSGCDLHHPDLVENLLPGMNFIQNGEPPQDDNQHGTHCAGILVAENNDIGVVGVVPKAKVIPVKALDAHGAGNLETVAVAIRWAADNGADIISMSLGSPTPLQQVRKAIQYAATKNIVTFCAAGNAGNTSNIFYPAYYDETVAIGSIDENFDRSSFSCTGENLDFMAPGGKILSTVPPNWYAVLSGTSMACPFAVGVAALLLSYSRNNHFDMPLKTAQDYIEALKRFTTPIDDPQYAGKKFFQGFGIIDPRKLGKWMDQQPK